VAQNGRGGCFDLAVIKVSGDEVDLLGRASAYLDGTSNPPVIVPQPVVCPPQLIGIICACHVTVVVVVVDHSFIVVEEGTNNPPHKAGCGYFVVVVVVVGSAIMKIAPMIHPASRG
jgi:hypothetical protein